MSARTSTCACALRKHEATVRRPHLRRDWGSPQARTHCRTDGPFLLQADVGGQDRRLGAAEGAGRHGLPSARRIGRNAAWGA